MARSSAALKHIFVIMLKNHSPVERDRTIRMRRTSRHTRPIPTRNGGAVLRGHAPEPAERRRGDLGVDWFVNDDNPAHRFDHTNLVDQLESNGLTWGAYMESMPSAGYLEDFAPSTGQQLYASKHNPFVLFDDIRSNPRAARQRQAVHGARERTSRKEATTPNFVWITPNQCHDMHGGVFTPVAPDGSDGTPCPFGSVKDDPNDASLKHKADDFVRGCTSRRSRVSQAWKSGHVRRSPVILTDENDFTE